MQESFAQKPDFFVGKIPIFGRLILSPMDGYSDLPFRSLTRRLGSAMSYTEFVNAIDVKFGHPHLDQRLTYQEHERPIVYQVFDDNVDRLVEAALRLREREPDIIDVNMGCSARNVSGRGAGAGLLQTPHKIETIFNRLSKALDIPVTGKIRLGWDESTQNYLDVARIIEQNGGQLIAVHGRTRQQGYGGQANWDAIAEVKQAVSVPVIGNGDVRTVADAHRLLDHTGCDGVMVGRATIGNPWIFSWFDREVVPPDLVRKTMMEHFESMLSFYGPEVGLLRFRKHASHYITPYRLSPEHRVRLLTSESPNEVVALLDELITAIPA